jgi:hypothetical protein
MQVNANDQIISPYFDRWTPTNDVFCPQWPIGFTTQGKFSWRSSKDNAPCLLQGITLGRLPPSNSLGSLGGKNNKKQIDHDKTNTEIERQTKNGTCLSKNKLEHKCVDHAGFITPEFLSATFAPNLQRPSSLRWTMMTQMPRLVSIDKHNTYIDTYA